MIYGLMLVFVLICSFMCFAYNFILGYTLLNTEIVLGLLTIISAILAVVLGIVYYQFYKVLQFILGE